MAEKKIKLVKMQNDSGKTADVHPAEVKNYESAGFREVKLSGSANKE